ncbi:MAG: 1-acyl-sn-glycerol-3-phosphate acyltransferase [Phycisphaerales bacterium]|nr:1-acyl-sn-glycerol-3-phosphate acyltransferase [Planctomycetota bacterium]MBL6997774.1 1-acyl-sn-glycerol-3-phosphate acyltransferase [Phycisphaerales bacterium]
MISVLRLLLRIFYRYKCYGREHVPRTGPILYIANHQSNFDPAIVGALVSDRPFKGIAKEELFNSKLLTAYMRGFGVISIKRGESDMSAIRSALAEFALGRCVMMFPEGTRTKDGEIGKFQRGFWLLVKKSKATIVPIGIDGAFDAYPAGSKPKLRGNIHAAVGTPITSDEVLSMGEEAGTAHVRSIIEGLMLQCRENISQSSK